MLSTRDSFKVGFLSRCVEEGIAPEDIGAVIEKTSAALDKVLEKQGHVVKDANLLDSLTKVPGALLDIAGRVAGPVIGAATSYGIPLALLAPPLAGGVAGYGLARMGDVSDEDVEAIRVKELINEYRLQADKAERDNRVRAYRKKRQSTGRIFL
jgi:hypothetical protein